MTAVARPPVRWVFAPQDTEADTQLARSLPVPVLLAQLLRQRGVLDETAARAYLAPLTVQLAGPARYRDLVPAMARIEAARKSADQVHIFGDYDVDGIAATAIMIEALRHAGIENLGWSLPHRISDGYGLTPAVVNNLAAQGVNLIITVDNGVAAHEAADTAAAKGIDLIITDHHVIEDTPPRTCATLHPELIADGHAPIPVCGSVVAAHLAEALTGSRNHLDLAALATVADVMPLTRENRAIVAQGIEAFRQAPRPGLEALLAMTNTAPGDLAASSFAYRIAPRLNAAGRIGTAHTALDLLLADDPLEAESLARKLNALNEERRELERFVWDDAAARIAGDTDAPGIVLSGFDWHPGVIGVVAARLQERFGVPVLLIALDENGLGRGSGRAPSGFDLAAILARCGHLCDQYGGHAGAAGLTIQERNIPAFTDAFHEAINEDQPKRIQPELTIDAVVSLGELDDRFMNLIDQLEPCGHANPAPIFAASGLEVVPGSPREMNGGHLRFTVRQRNKEFTAVGFSMAESFPASTIQGRIDVAFTPVWNTWRNVRSIQLHLHDLRSA